MVEMIGEHIARFPSPSGHVFTSPGGGPVRHRNLHGPPLRGGGRSLRLPTGLRFHDLRHTARPSSSLRDGTPSRYRRASVMPASKLVSTATAICSTATTQSYSRASTRWSGPRVSNPCATRVQELPKRTEEAPQRAPDLHVCLSGRPDSNWRPSPWQGEPTQFPDLRFLVFSLLRASF